MKKLGVVATASLMLAATAWIGGTGPAMADYQSERDALCGTDEVDVCSITIRNDEPYTLVEGVGSLTVDIVGNPGVTAQVQMYSIMASERPFMWESVRATGVTKSFTTDASGKAVATVLIPVQEAPYGAKTAVTVQLAGSDLDTTQDQPIANSDESQAPHLTGVRSARGADLNYLTSVADGSLEAEVGGGITGQVYGVQLKINGTWTDVSDRGLAGNGRVDADGYAVVHADVSGLKDGGYDMRMFNRTKGIYDLKLNDFQGSVSIVKNIYITPGEHTSAGRKWRTACEPYSQTDRCRTEIWSTEVVYRAGKLVKDNGWHFNNLTYKEAPRELWKGNPLAVHGKHLINGRQWRTECETFTSGRNGCRSYIVSDVVQATKQGSSYTYKMVRKEVFNNIVMFEIDY